MDFKKPFTFFKFLIIAISVLLINVGLPQGIYRGDSAAVGDGMVHTWVQIDGNGKPEAIGITMTESVLSNLPPSALQYSLDFPIVASDSLFTHSLFDWNPQGHEPPGVYDLPHFDIHFYIVSVAERQAIVAGYDTFTVQSQFLPPDYVPLGDPPFSVPQMGAHWVDTLSPEWQGDTFTRTFIYGYHHGDMYFVEPMITKEYFESNPMETLEIKQPQSYQKPGYYATNYSIEYDSNDMLYKIYLKDFVYSSPTSVEQEDDLIPQSIVLNQNYPNPFNPSTKIKYSIPQLSNVAIKVYDILGNEVAVLVNETKSQGSYEVTFNTMNLPSGVYFYRLDAGDFVETKKMILMK